MVWTTSEGHGMLIQRSSANSLVAMPPFNQLRMSPQDCVQKQMVLDENNVQHGKVQRIQRLLPAGLTMAGLDMART